MHWPRVIARQRSTRSQVRLAESEPATAAGLAPSAASRAWARVPATVLLIGGCYGIGIIYPLARALKEKGNRVISVIEGRSSFLLYWRERLEAVSDEVVYATKDLSLGDDRDAADVIEGLVKKGVPLQRVFVNGCTFLMYHMSQVTKPHGIKTIVSLNPIMIDGTGMCGACRVSVGGETKFACVDGPDFDGHLVDWDLLLARRKAYLGPETASVER